LGVDKAIGWEVDLLSKPIVIGFDLMNFNNKKLL
jgi:hypothetical protein